MVVIGKIDNKKVSIKLDRNIAEDMIGTYECLLWQNKGSDDVKDIRKIIKALKKSLNENNS